MSLCKFLVLLVVIGGQTPVWWFEPPPPLSRRKGPRTTVSNRKKFRWKNVRPPLKNPRSAPAQARSQEFISVRKKLMTFFQSSQIFFSVTVQNSPLSLYNRISTSEKFFTAKNFGGSLKFLGEKSPPLTGLYKSLAVALSECNPFLVLASSDSNTVLLL